MLEKPVAVRIMNHYISWIGAIFVVLSGSCYAQEHSYDFCADDGREDICATIPYDLRAIDAEFEYHFLADGPQEPFDRFAWRSFVGLNWKNETKKAVWDQYETERKINRQCEVKQDELHLHKFYQTSGRPLIDRAGNYVLYETRYNDVLAKELSKTDSKEYVFNSGKFNGNIPGALMLKFAWRVLTDQESSNEFITRKAIIEVTKEDSQTKKTLCLSVQVGLVGLHIVQKTSAGMGDHWIWSTFEHKDNAPLSLLARRPERSFRPKMFKKGCPVPEKINQAYNFFASDTVPSSNGNEWKWQKKQPFAVDSLGQEKARDQVVRCWEILRGTQITNQIWQNALKDSKLRNYILVGSQWRGNFGGDEFGVGELPRFLSNTSMESFIQEDGSCMSCHQNAQDSKGRFSDFTFLVRDH